jgi:O-antigen/teichoic acid export membrane protein
MDSLSNSDETSADVAASAGNLADPEVSLAVAAAGSTLWNLASQVLATGIGLASAGLLTIWLTPADYGLFGMAGTVVSFFGVLGDGGLSSALIRKAQIGSVEETTGFAMGMLGGGILALGALIAAPLLGLCFHSRVVGVMAAVLATNFLILAPSRVSFAKLTRGLRFRALSILAVFVSVLGAVAGVVTAARGAGGWSLVISTLVAAAAMTALYLLAAPPRIKRGQFSPSLAREMSVLGVNLSGFSLAVAVAFLPSMLLLGRFGGPAAVGLFSMGIRLVVLSTQKLGSAFGAVFLPSVMRVPAAERQRVYIIALRTLAMCTAPVAFGVIAVADEVVRILPASWTNLAPTLRGFAIGAAVEPLPFLAIALLTAQGRSGTLLRLGLITIPITWVGFALAAWFGGLASFVITRSVLSVLGAIIFLGVTAESVGEALAVLRALRPPLLAAILMAGIVEGVQRLSGTSGKAIGLPIGVVAGVASFVGLVHVFMPEDFLRARRLVLSSFRR